MDNVWAVLFDVGLLVPLLVLAGTCILVMRWGRRLQGLDPGAPPAWRYLLLHLAIVLGSQLLLAFLPAFMVAGLLGGAGVLGLVAMVIVPYRLHSRLRRFNVVPSEVALPRWAMPEPPNSPSVASPLPHRQRAWGLATLFVLTGVFIPWVTAIGVKLYLDAQGRPTHAFSEFLGLTTVVVLLMLTLANWAFPFLLLAVTALFPPRFGLPVDPSTGWGRLPVWLAFGVGVAAAVPVFIGVFWEFDTMYLIVPMGLWLLVPMAVAYAAGVATLWLRSRA